LFVILLSNSPAEGISGGTMKRVLLIVSIVSVVWACDRKGSPPIPSSPSPAPQPTPPAPLLPIHGYVYDTAFRPVAGASVQMVDGAQAGTMTTSDADGRFSYDGTFAIPVTLRASKDGYTSATQATIAITGGGWAYFELASVASPVAVAGNYTLTITADSACAALPEDVRTRTYQAVVTAGGNTRLPAGTSLSGTVAGGQFAPFANTFFVGVFGDYVAASTNGEGPTIVEQVGPNRYVAFLGEADFSVGSAGISTITAPFKGTIEYCGLNSALAQSYECSPSLAAVREECTSNNSQLTMTRR
jgi:hypothetical protein